MSDNNVSTDLIFLEENKNNNEFKSSLDENYDFFYFNKKKINFSKWLKNKNNKKTFFLFLLLFSFLIFSIVFAILGFENSFFVIVISESCDFYFHILFSVLSTLFFTGFICLSIILFFRLIDNKKLVASLKERKKYLNELKKTNKLVLIDIDKNE